MLSFSNDFSVSIDMIICFLYFNLLIWCIVLIDLWILKSPWIIGVNHTLIVVCDQIYIYIYRAAPSAYGCSLARGQIGATAASLCHSNEGSEPLLWTTPQIMATQWAMGQTHILIDASQGPYHWSTKRTSHLMYCWIKPTSIFLRIFASMFISDIGL